MEAYVERDRQTDKKQTDGIALSRIKGDIVT